MTHEEMVKRYRQMPDCELSQLADIYIDFELFDTPCFIDFRGSFCSSIFMHRALVKSWTLLQDK